MKQAPTKATYLLIDPSINKHVRIELLTESSYPCSILTLTEADDIHSHYYCIISTRNKEHYITYD